MESSALVRYAAIGGIASVAYVLWQGCKKREEEEVLPQRSVPLKNRRTEGQSSVVCVTGISRDVNEEDVLQLLAATEPPLEVDLSEQHSNCRVWVRYQEPLLAASMVSRLEGSIWREGHLSARCHPLCHRRDPTVPKSVVTPHLGPG